MIIMGIKSVKFTIDSNLENVPLIGMSVNKLCSSTSFSDIDSFSIELCVVEAITNSIKHSYCGESGHEITVVFTLTQEDVTFDICDIGACSMDPEVLDKAVIEPPGINISDIEGIAEGGRGLGIMKEIMDRVVYRSEEGENCLTLIKKLPVK
jgi:serine/threonine-protein kinase RsbW